MWDFYHQSFESCALYILYILLPSLHSTPLHMLNWNIFTLESFYYHYHLIRSFYFGLVIKWIREKFLILFPVNEWKTQRLGKMKPRGKWINKLNYSFGFILCCWINIPKRCKLYLSNKIIYGYHIYTSSFESRSDEHQYIAAVEMEMDGECFAYLLPFMLFEGWAHQMWALFLRCTVLTFASSIGRFLSSILYRVAFSSLLQPRVGK